MKPKSIACALAIGVALVTSSAAATGDEERKLAVNQLKTMYMALPALMEAERTDLVDLLLRAIHGYEVRLEGRDDNTARIIRARAPERGQVIELLGFAAHKYREWGANDRADTLERMISQLWDHGEERVRDNERRHKVRDAVAKRLGEELETMRIARHALLEAERENSARELERVMHVHEMILEGHGERAVGNAMEEGPTLGQQVELLNHSAHLWDEFGHEGKAARVRELARQYMERFEQRRDRESRARGRNGVEGEYAQRIEQLQEQIEELKHSLGDLKEELRRQR